MRESRSLILLIIIYLTGFAFAIAQQAPTPPKPVTLPLTGTITYTPPTTVVGPMGPAGPKGDPGKDGRDGKDGTGVGGSGRGIDVTQAPYLVGTGGDDEDGLRRLLSTFVGNQAHTLTLPKASLGFVRPLLVYKDNTTIDGAGIGETLIFTYGRYDAFAIGQLDPTTPDGQFTYDYNSRPDISKVLDGTVAGYGFRTLGRNYAIDKGNGLQFGTYDRRINCWSYWGNTPGFTVEYAISGNPAPGYALFGCNATPFSVVVANANTIWHAFSMEGDAVNVPRISVIKGLDFTRPVNRVRESHDFVTGEVVVWVNGVNQTPTPNSPGDLDIKGKSLKRNDHDQPFMIGPPVGPVPDFTLLGLKVTAAPVPNDAGNDRDRYLTQGPGVVGGFDSTVRDPQGYRGLRMFGGPAAPEGYGYALVFDRKSFGQSVSGTYINDLEINSGIMLAGVLKTKIERVKATGKGTGLDAAHNFASYKIKTVDCTFGGDVAAIKGYNWTAVHNDVDLITGGMASSIMTGCKNTWNEPWITGFGVRQEWAFVELSGMYAGEIFFNSLTVDGEFQVLRKGGFLVENCVGLARVLSVNGGAIDGIAPDGYAFYLADAPAGSGATAAHIEVKNFGFGASTYVGSDWYGTVDATINGPADLSKPRLTPTPVGPGAGKVKFGP